MNRTPSILVTHNPAFNDAEEYCTTPARRKCRETYYKMSDYYGIDRSRIIYKNVGKRVYVGERAENFRLVLDKYKDEFKQSKVFLSDGGSGYKENGESVIEAAGLNHVIYKSAIHQWLSPNDNRHHGRTKGIWKTGNPEWEQDLQETLHLMHIMDNDPKNHMVEDFERNLMLGEGKPTVGRASEILGDGKSKMSNYQEWCDYLYRSSIMKEADLMDPTRSLIPSELDGAYWAER